MKKVFEIEGSRDDYIVTFSDESGKLQASCTCPAGEHCTICKHITEVIETDEEVRESLENYGLLGAYNDYLDKEEEVEALKIEAKNLKRKFARLLLGNYRDKKTVK